MMLDEISETKMSRRNALVAISTLSISVIILSACATKPSTEAPGEMTQLARTETAPVETTTLEATEVAEPAFIEWENVELEIGGRPVEFVIGKEEGVDLWSKWGIESIEINENLPNYKEKFATLISAYLWQDYVYQSSNEISFEEFIQNPENYKINLVSPDGNGWYQSTAFTLDQIKRVEMRYVQRDDPRLYYSNSSVTGKDNDFGYKFKTDGTLIMYLSHPDENPDLDIYALESSPYFDEKSAAYTSGYNIGNYACIGWLVIGYSRDLASPEAVNVGKDSAARFTAAVEQGDYPLASSLYEGATGLQAWENMKKNILVQGFFVALFK
jgi:hypothetical protein